MKNGRSLPMFGGVRTRREQALKKGDQFPKDRQCETLRLCHCLCLAILQFIHLNWSQNKLQIHAML